MSASIVVSLGVGISTLVGVVAIRGAILGKGLTLSQSDRVVHWFTRGTEFTGGRVWTVFKGTVEAASRDSVLFASVAAYDEAPAMIRGDGWATRIAAAYVSAPFMSIAGSRP